QVKARRFTPALTRLQPLQVGRALSWLAHPDEKFRNLQHGRVAGTALLPRDRLQVLESPVRIAAPLLDRRHPREPLRGGRIDSQSLLELGLRIVKLLLREVHRSQIRMVQDRRHPRGGCPPPARGGRCGVWRTLTLRGRSRGSRTPLLPAPDVTQSPQLLLDLLLGRLVRLGCRCG